VPINRGGISPYSIVTSGTRPSNPNKGQAIYETDTNLFYYYDGLSWRLNGAQTVGHSVLGASATTIAINLPSITNGQHLLVETLLQSDTSSIDAQLQPNADNTSGNYFHQFMHGSNTNATAAQSAATGARMGYLDNGSTYWAGASAWIFDYAGSKQKTIQSMYGSPWGLTTSALMFMNATVWKSTSAITSLTLRTSSGNFRSGSMMSIKVVGSV